MKKISTKNRYYDSDGNSYSQNQINNRITEAKAEKLDQMRCEYGYVFCEEEGCGKNENCGEMLDCSHDVSVKEAKEIKQVELCWSVKNIKIRCRTCHRKKDKSGLQWVK